MVHLVAQAQIRAAWPTLKLQRAARLTAPHRIGLLRLGAQRSLLSNAAMRVCRLYRRPTASKDYNSR